MRFIFHMMLHFIVPGAAARRLDRDAFFKSWGIMSATILVDLDHLLASPVCDPGRCGIGFHPLHSAAAVGGFALLSFLPTNRWVRRVGLGLVIHMALDMADCLMM